MSLQNALKQVYYAFGGNAEDLRDTNDVVTIILAIARVAGGGNYPEAKGKDF